MRERRQRRMAGGKRTTGGGEKDDGGKKRMTGERERWYISLPVKSVQKFCLLSTGPSFESLGSYGHVKVRIKKGKKKKAVFTKNKKANSCEVKKETKNETRETGRISRFLDDQHDTKKKKKISNEADNELVLETSKLICIGENR